MLGLQSVQVAAQLAALFLLVLKGRLRCRMLHGLDLQTILGIHQRCRQLRASHLFGTVTLAQVQFPPRRFLKCLLQSTVHLHLRIPFAG
ncbi:hypothetical protein D3C72_1134200 [compost metagenome]